MGGKQSLSSRRTCAHQNRGKQVYYICNISMFYTRSLHLRDKRAYSCRAFWIKGCYRLKAMRFNTESLISV